MSPAKTIKPELTPAGRKQLTAEASAFDQSVAAIARVMRASEG